GEPGVGWLQGRAGRAGTATPALGLATDRRPGPQRAPGQPRRRFDAPGPFPVDGAGTGGRAGSARPLDRALRAGPGAGTGLRDRLNGPGTRALPVPAGRGTLGRFPGGASRRHREPGYTWQKTT